MTYIGLDIAKLTFVVGIKQQDTYHVKEFDNQESGFAEMTKWIDDFDIRQAHYCMESTGKYGFALAAYLYKNKQTISVVNPFKIKHFGKSLMLRNKTDQVDAKLIAQFCEVHKPSAWTPKSQDIERLSSLTKRLLQLEKMLRQDKKRLELETQNEVIESINKLGEELQKQIDSIENLIAQTIANNDELVKNASLLKSINGVGNKTIYCVLSKLGHPKQFQSAKQFAAYIGINPEHKQSGTSLNKSSISKMGDRNLRKILYMPTLSAIQCNPLIKEFYQRLVANGKPKKLAVCAAMRKLLFIIFGVLKHETKFDINFANTKNCG